MLACAQSQWTLASVYFWLAGVFRSNGVLLSGFILWGVLVEPFVKERTVRRACSNSIHLLVFTVVKVDNQTRSIRSVVDRLDVFARGLPSVLRISSFLSRYQYTRTLVLKLSSFDLYPCAVRILERGTPPVLDTTTGSKFPACSAGPCAIVVLFHSICPLVRNSSLHQVSATKPFSFRVSVSRTPWHSRVRLHVYPPVRIAHTNNPSIRRLATVYLLVGGTAAGRTPTIGKVVGGLECCVGSCFACPLVGVPAPSLTSIIVCPLRKCKHGPCARRG
jgi:hypothetical protein